MNANLYPTIEEARAEAPPTPIVECSVKEAEREYGAVEDDALALEDIEGGAD